MKILAFLILLALPALAEDWQTTDGKTYQEVKVIKVEADAVTILYRDGGARVSLSVLPADLQQKFHYDPEKAEAAALKYAAEMKSSQAFISSEKNQIDARNSTNNFKDALLSGSWTLDDNQKIFFKDQSANYEGITASWKITGNYQVTLTMVSSGILHTAVLNFNNDLSSYTGLNFNGRNITGILIRPLTEADKVEIQNKIYELTDQINALYKDATIRGKEYMHENSGLSENGAATHGDAENILNKDNELLRKLISERSALQYQLEKANQPSNENSPNGFGGHYTTDFNR